MFSFCKQIHPATGIEHSISCHFFNKCEKSIVTAGANIVKIFRLVPDVDIRNRNERFTGLCIFKQHILVQTKFLYLQKCDRPNPNWNA